MAGKTIRIRDTSTGVHVSGLRELQAELRRADPEMGRQLQRVNKELVDRVAHKAYMAVYDSVDSVSFSIRDGPDRLRPSRAGLSRVRDSIKGSASGREARIRAGGARVPSFYGFEFGGSRGITGRKTTRQFPVHLGTEGYFLYPTVREELKTAHEQWSEIFDEMFP